MEISVMGNIVRQSLEKMKRHSIFSGYEESVVTLLTEVICKF